MLSSVTNLLHFKTCKTNVLLNHVITLSPDRYVIVLETREGKSWINGFDLPNEDVHSWGFILTLIVDRLRVFVRIIL